MLMGSTMSCPSSGAGRYRAARGPAALPVVPLPPPPAHRHLCLSPPSAAVLIKGGIWKNTEDEILKAAVMK